MSTIASQIAGGSIVCSTICSGADQRKNIEPPRHWPLWWESTGDRWIPHTKGQLSRKRFHLMTSSLFESSSVMEDGQLCMQEITMQLTLGTRVSFPCPAAPTLAGYWVHTGIVYAQFVATIWKKGNAVTLLDLANFVAGLRGNIDHTAARPSHEVQTWSPLSLPLCSVALLLTWSDFNPSVDK